MSGSPESAGAGTEMDPRMDMAIIVISALSVCAWLYLLLMRGDFWRTRERLAIPPARPAWPSVVAIVPARDEARTIADTVRAVLSQSYPANRLDLIVVDDQSEDGTADLAREAAAALKAQDRLQVVAGSAPPSEWTGKLWALEQGWRAARARGLSPDYLWLTDADIDHGPRTLRRLSAKAEDDDRDLVSLMVRLKAEGAWARLLVPPFVFFFRKVYPFSWANDPRRSTAAAAGGCVLLRRSAFEAIGGFGAIAGEIIDDCALARMVKSAGRPGGGRIWVGLAERSRSLRPYRGLRDIWAMVARSAFAQLRNSRWLLFGTLVAMALLYLLPPASVLAWPWHGQAVVGLLGLAGWAMMTVAMAPMLKFYGQSPLRGVLLPLAALLYCAMTVDSARAYARGRGGLWKGRAQAAGRAAEAG